LKDETESDLQNIVNTYYQLGNIAADKNDLSSAETYYLKALKIFENQKNEKQAANIYQKLGQIAMKQNDSQNAEIWYRKFLDFVENKEHNL